jgi:hypothetical protein
MADPALLFRAGFGFKHPASFPQIFDDVDDVDDKRQIKIILFGQAFEVTDLGLVAIDQSDPGFFA